MNSEDLMIEIAFDLRFDISAGFGLNGVQVEEDPVFSVSPAAGITGQQINDWITAFGWGNHADAGYLTSETDPVFSASPAAGIGSQDINDWTAAFGWGNHAAAGYLTNETDPVFAASPAAGISAPMIAEWVTAYNWGDHSNRNYARIITTRSNWQSGDNQIIRSINLNSAARRFQLELVLTGSITGANTIAILVNNVATNSYQSTQSFPGGSQIPSGVIGYLRLPSKSANTGGAPTLYRLYLECQNYQGITSPRYFKGWFVEVRTDINTVTAQGEIYGIFYTSLTNLTSLRFSSVDSGNIFAAGSYIEISEYL